MNFSWIDAVLVLVLAVATAYGARRRMIGLVVGVGAVLLLKPLLVVSTRSPMLALAAALLGGVLLALLSQRMSSQTLRQRWPTMVAGGVGGFLLGAAMVTALVTALPIERAASDSRSIYYPPVNAPLGLSSALQRSPLVNQYGRTVVLLPLLSPADQGNSAVERAVYQGLRTWFVASDPWN